MHDDFRVHGALEQCPLTHELIPQDARVRQLAAVIAHHERLSVDQAGASGRRVARVPERYPPRQRLQNRTGKTFCNKSFHLVYTRESIGECSNACRLLAAMLERIKAKEGD